MAFIVNGNKESPPELAEDVVQIVVIGERRCGKTRFVRSFYDYHLPAPMYSDNAVRVYPCGFLSNNRWWKIAMLEIPGDHGFVESQRTPYYTTADVIVFMYAIDDPLSFQMIIERWIPEAIDIIKSCGINVAVVGTKRDLRNDQQVIQRLELNNQIPVTYDQGLELISDFDIERVPVFMECSATIVEEVNATFEIIFYSFISDQ